MISDVCNSVLVFSLNVVAGFFTGLNVQPS